MSLLGFPLDVSQLSPQTMVLFVVFAVALYFIFKAVKFVTTAVMVAVAAAIFPFAANLMGMSVSTSLESIITFIIWGLVLFIVVVFFKKIILVLKTITWPIRKLLGR